VRTITSIMQEVDATPRPSPRVEEQGAATAEISRNVQMAARARGLTHNVPRHGDPRDEQCADDVLRASAI